MLTKYRRFICKCDNDWMTVLPDIDTCQVCYDDEAHQDIANWIKNIDQSDRALLSNDAASLLRWRVRISRRAK